MRKFIEIGDGLIVSTDSIQSIYTNSDDPSLKIEIILKHGTKYIYTFESKDILNEEYEKLIENLKVKNSYY